MPAKSTTTPGFPTRPKVRLRRGFRIALAFVLAVGIAAGVPGVREPILRAMGQALVAEDPLSPADAIVITLDSGAAGALEAADLVRAGVAQRVVIFADPPSTVELEFARRGVPYESEAAVQERQLGSLGVHSVERVARPEAGTEGEAQVLPLWCDRNGLRSVVVVSSNEHSRRVRRTFARSMEDHATRVIVRPSRFSRFEPDRWWQSRGGVRAFIIEWEKLLLDFVRHPW